jgi:N-acetyl sugar amidotransferase
MFDPFSNLGFSIVRETIKTSRDNFIHLAAAVRYCKKCVMPDTKPDLSLNKDGICDACLSTEKKEKVDWDARKKEMAKILEKYRSKDGRNYDCIIPVSGGKDSTFQTLTIKEMGFNPLCVTFEPTHPTELGKRNLANLRKLGVDLISIEKNPDVYRKLCWEGFTKVGDHDWPNHVGIFTAPVRVAVNYKVPLIIWGENPQLEYGGPASASDSAVLDRNWLNTYGGLLNLKIEDMIGRNGLTRKDLMPYIYPSEEELRNVGVTGLFLGYYIKWDARRQVELIKKRGFSVSDGPIEGTYVDYENLDCNLVSIHDYLKYTKYGFGRASDHASIDIRNGRISRKRALELVKKYDGKLFRHRVSQFCEFFGISEDQFFKIVDGYTNKKIFKMDDRGRFIRDVEGNLVNLAIAQQMQACGID